MQMDRMILRASNPEDVLTVLVSHRGVLFVHNLVTALSSLATMSHQDLPFSKFKQLKRPTEYQQCEKDKMLEDARYLLLLRDLMDYSSKLDLRSIETILSALQQLDHCHYRLMGCLLKRVYAIALTPNDISVAISVGATLEWAGFGTAESFYGKLSTLLVSEINSISSMDYLNSLFIFSKLPRLYPSAMEVFAKCMHLHAKSFSPKQLGFAAIALSTYGGEVIPAVRSSVGEIADELLLRSSSLRDLTRGCVALRRVNLWHGPLLDRASEVGQEEIRTAGRSATIRLSEPSPATLSDLSQLVESCAHFGLNAISDLSPFLEQNIDVITEEAAIRFLFGFSMFPTTVVPATAPLVSLLVRKLGSSAGWEKHKMKIVGIFFSKVVNFAFVDAEIRKLVLDKSLHHFLVARRGYSVPFPEVSQPLFDALNSEFPDVWKFNAWIPHSPYHADLLSLDRRIAVLVLSQFDQRGKPVGTDLLQAKHVESLGWQVLCVDWRVLKQQARGTSPSLFKLLVAT